MKKKIAILGGGMGALSAAYELTRRPGHGDRFEITVYQMGFRLGGKGASGVDLERRARVEEHGLHLLWGYYENTFRMMRECYAELGRPEGAPMATWDLATEPVDGFVVSDRAASGWSFWAIEAPRHDGRPGEPAPIFDPPAALRAVIRAAQRLLGGEEAPAISRALAAALPELRARARALAGEDGEGRFAALEARLRDLVHGAVSGVLQGTRILGAAGAAVLDLDLAELLVGSATRDDDEARADRSAVARLLRRVARHLVGLGGLTREDRHRRVLLDLALSAARGIVVDDLLVAPRDWSRIDDEDFRAWLRRHGAAEESVGSGLVEGLYAALFAGAEMGAGTLLYGALRLAFTHQGALLYRMLAGMGETVFAPLYQVLRARGVRFEFFHTVDHLELAAGERRVARVILDRQATPREGRYDPLVDVDGLPCWPVAPRYEQLVEGEALRASGQDLEDWWTSWAPVERVVLEAGRDFDAVVLGISLGALPEVCRELVADAENPRFAAMVQGVATTQSQAAQLWFGPSAAQLGWAGSARAIVLPFAPPFDAWADMSHLLRRERDAAGVSSLAYLTGRLDDDEPVPPRGPSGYPARQRARVREHLEQWLSQSAVGLWPAAASRHDPAALNWAWLADPQHRLGPGRLEAHYWCAPKNPSDRYVLSLPGTRRLRLRADESGYDNLFLAGDWTRTAISGGCLEGAVMGGIQAARALDPGARQALDDWLEALERPAGRRPGTPSPTPGAPPLGPLVVAARRPLAAVRKRDLPRYVPRDGELLAAPPIGLGIRMYAFALRADTARLAALCDAQLNLGGPTRYRPLAPFVVLYFAHVDNHPLEEPLGHVPEQDVGIWVPLAAGRSREGGFEPERVVLYTPYIWVDHPLALTIGRAVYGFKKELADVSVPASLDGSPLTVDTWVIPRFGPRATAEKRRLLEVRRATSGPWQRAKTMARSGTQALGAAADLLARDRSAEPWRGALDFAQSALTDAQRGVSMVFLKQLPDVTDARRACYQAVVESDVAFTSPVEGGPLTDPFELTVDSFDSHRLTETLGLTATRRAAGRAVITPFAAGWSNFEARIGPGTSVWEAG